MIPALTPRDMVVTSRGLWFWGRLFPFSIGRGGITRHKREGDGATPAGIHHVAGCLYRADRMASPRVGARAIGPRDLWCDDPQDQNYNMMMRGPYAASHERLRRGDRQYDLVLITDWNWPHATPGKGSAIFIHAWRGPGLPTAGCVALAAPHLRWITKRIEHNTRLIVPPSGIE